MTKREIILALEALRDLTNDQGKATIHAIKTGVEALHEDQPELKHELPPSCDAWAS